MDEESSGGLEPQLQPVDNERMLSCLSPNDSDDKLARPGSSTEPGSETNSTNSGALNGANTGSAPVGAITGTGPDGTDLRVEPSGTGRRNVYRPPSMRARLQKQDGGGPDLNDASIPTVPTFEQYMLQQVNATKTKGPFARESVHQSIPSTFPERNTRRTDGDRSNWSKNRSDAARSNHSFNRNEYPQRKRHQSSYANYMSCSMLAEIAQSESLVIIEKINRQKEGFKQLLETTPDERNRDVFPLVFELITNVWVSSFEEKKKLLLLEICNSKFIDHLQLYLMQLPYTEGSSDKRFNKHYWSKEKQFWSNFMTFCECLINVSPSTAVRKCGALIEATSKSCLDGLRLNDSYEFHTSFVR